MDINGSWQIERTALSTHVKAVKFISEYLVIGCGNKIHCYDWKRKQHCTSVTVFQGIHSVHGIRLISRTQNAATVLCFGGKVFRVYELVFSTLCFRVLTDIQSIPDWIHDVQHVVTHVSSKEKSDVIALVTAHNSVILWNWMLKEKIAEYHCSSKCILYAAKILSCFAGNIVVGCGTVFKEILIWSPNTSCEQMISPLHCLTGHQGVIFSINFNVALGLLCSSSDDRSLRLWKFHTEHPYERSDYIPLKCWTDGCFRLVHVLYAHESRVWTSAVLNTCVISVGEDSSVCLWKHDGCLITRQKCHRGGSIWCLDVNEDSTLAATGGSDSGVLLWNVQENLEAVDAKQLTMFQKFEDKDFPRNLLLLSLNNHLVLFVVTDKGKLLAYDADSNVLLFEGFDRTFASYSVLSASSSSEFILIGSLCGDISLYQLKFDVEFELHHVKKIRMFDSKLNSIHWLDDSLQNILVCGMDGHMILCQLNLCLGGGSFSSDHELHLPKSKHHWWSTVALFVKSADSLVVGDRSGSVHLYGNISDLASNEKKLPDHTYLYVHGKNGVCDAKVHGNFLYTCGADGQLIVYHVHERGIHKLHHAKVTNELEWIGKILVYCDDIILLGFHATEFVAWSQKQERSIMKISCGGGHRSWNFAFSGSDMSAFAAIRKREVILARRKTSLLAEGTTFQLGMSGVTFCCACYLFARNDGKHGDIAVLACGGEEPSLKLIACVSDCESPAFFMLQNISGHLSSIRAISKCQMPDKDSLLVVSVGGRAQMILWKISNGTEITCEQLACDFLWNVDKRARKPWKCGSEPIVDPLTRYMDVAVWPSSSKPEEFFIGSACSDSFIRLHVFKSQECNLSLFATVKHGDHCVLKARALQVGCSHKTVCLSTASNDGFIRIYSTTVLDSPRLDEAQRRSAVDAVNDDGYIFQNKPLVCKRFHQSGINALDTRHTSDDTWLVVSGGDDNAVSAVLVNIKTSFPESCSVIAFGAEKNAHASQVSGVHILTDRNIVSVSVDQRLNIWDLKRYSDQIQIQMLHSSMCCIPDVINLEVWMHSRSKKEWKAVVCGEGLEALNLSQVNGLNSSRYDV